MNTRRTTYLVALIGTLVMPACTSIPTRIHDSGVNIQPVSNDSGSIRSAGFWMDRKGVILRGKFSPNPADKIPVTGHIDVSITVPDGSNSVCTTAQLVKDRQYAGNAFVHRFVSLPPRGSFVRVWHHPVTAIHSNCAS